MDTQEEGGLQREQDIEALIRRFPRLSTERCPCSYVNLGRAIFNREQDIKALWPEYVDNTIALELIVVLFRLNLAIWRCQHKRSVATTLIRQYVSCLLACRQADEKTVGSS